MTAPLHRTSLVALFAIIVGLTGLAAPALAQDEDPAFREAREAAEKAFAELRQKHGDAKHVLLVPGMMADRKARTVTIWGAAAELDKHDPVEFLLITRDSGKDYEARAIAFTTAADIHAGLRFIGMEPGEPVNYDRFRFWPKGEPVTMSFTWKQEGKQITVPAWQLLWNTQTDKPVQLDHLLYVGSYWITRDENRRVYAADESDAGSIASTYNEPTTVLDVPLQSAKGVVYGWYVPNPKYRFTEYQPVRIKLAPALPAGKRQVTELTWRIDQPEAGKPPRFTLIHGEKVLAENQLMPPADALNKLREDDKTLYVHVVPTDRIELRAMHVVANQLIAGMERPDGIRVEPPRQGQLFYRAFTGDPRWRDRDQRVFQGWELHVERAEGGKLDWTLIDLQEKRMPDGAWKIVENRVEADTPEALSKALKAADKRGPRDIFVFAPPEMTYGELREILAPSLQHHKTVLVYLDE